MANEDLKSLAELRQKMKVPTFTNWETSDLEQAIRESADVQDVLYQAQGYMTESQYREFLKNIAMGVVI